MKKYLLAAIFATAAFSNQTIQAGLTAADLLDGFEEEQAEKQLDEALGKGLVELLRTSEFAQEFVRMVRLKFSQNELKRLVTLFNVMIQIDEKSTDPAFIEQYRLLMEAAEIMQQEDMTEEQMVQLDAEVRKKCPLVMEWQALSEDLKELMDGIFQEMQTFRLDEVLNKVVPDLEKTV